MRGIGLQIARHPVIEAHPKGQQQVGFLDGLVDPGFAVHAHHAQVQRVAGRQAADPQQRHRHRDLRLFGEVAQLLHGVAHQHAVPGQDQRALGLAD